MEGQILYKMWYVSWRIVKRYSRKETLAGVSNFELVVIMRALLFLGITRLPFRIRAKQSVHIYGPEGHYAVHHR